MTTRRTASGLREGISCRGRGSSVIGAAVHRSTEDTRRESVSFEALTAGQFAQDYASRRALVDDATAQGLRVAPTYCRRCRGARCGGAVGDARPADTKKARGLIVHGRR
jgi:hypothetical protein